MLAQCCIGVQVLCKLDRLLGVCELVDSLVEAAATARLIGRCGLQEQAVILPRSPRRGPEKRSSGVEFLCLWVD